ncbi:MAG: tyrosine-type recombinase/integrase [Acetobacteraceae bacterium]
MASHVQPTRLKYVQAVKARGQIFLYYRRDGRRVPLSGPEGSAAFLHDYDAAQAAFEQPSTPWGRHTVGHAITDYLGSADFQQLDPNSKRQYRHYLDELRDGIGQVFVADIDIPWVERLRDRMAASPHRWNAMRSRMKEVFARYRRLHPELLPINPWDEVRRITPPRSTQNRRWPDHVLQAVLREATPEFSALLITLLLTGQRVGDVIQFTPRQYDAASRTLGFEDVFDQEKVAKRLVLHVPDSLAGQFAALAGRHPDRLLTTPRGKPWTVVNAEETLLALRQRLGLERYTLHGLRKTGVTALKMQGMENRRLRALTGHDSDRNLEVYLDGVDNHALAREAQDALDRRYTAILTEARTGANQRRYSGVTGRAAAKTAASRASTAQTGGTNEHPAVANGVANVKPLRQAREKS